MKGYYEMEWPLSNSAPRRHTKERFDFEYLENRMEIKIPEDFKDFQYRNANCVYPDKPNYNLYDEKGEVTIGLYGNIQTYLGYDDMIRSQEIVRRDLGEIYYWHLPLLIIGEQRVILDYTDCKENPPVVWVNEEIGPYEGKVGMKNWKRYIAPTFKDFIEMIGDRNNPVGDWIDEDLLDDGTRVGK